MSHGSDVAALAALRARVDALSAAVAPWRAQLLTCLEVASTPHNAFTLARLLVEDIARALLLDLGLATRGRLLDYLDRLREPAVASRNLVPMEVVSLLDLVRVMGNKAAHGALKVDASAHDVALVVGAAHRVVAWYDAEFVLRPAKAAASALRSTPTVVDWGDAPSVGRFFGRTDELATVGGWLADEACRVVVVRGLRGVGKTRLAVTAGRAASHGFEFVLWRRLLDAPPAREVVAAFVEQIDGTPPSAQPVALEARVEHLVGLLSRHRCLLLLDNAESVMRGDAWAPEHVGYGALLARVEQGARGSVVLVTSRALPGELAARVGRYAPSRALELHGLDVADGRRIFEDLDAFSGTDADWAAVVRVYDGNPLALELAARHVRDVFFGDLAAFLEGGRAVFADLEALLDWHFGQLEPAARDILFWFCVRREPVSLAQLRHGLPDAEARAALTSTLQHLQRQLPLERAAACFTVQPVLIEYLTLRLVEGVVGQLYAGKPALMDTVAERLVSDAVRDVTQGSSGLLTTHPLVMATAPQHVQAAQRRVILGPIAERLVSTLGGPDAVLARLQGLLDIARRVAPGAPSYLAGNVINLALHLGFDLRGWDLARLCIWQADLRGRLARGASMIDARLRDCAFTQPFGSLLAVAVTPDGEAALASDASGAVHLWRLADGQRLATLAGHTDWVRTVAVSADGQRAATGCEDHSVRVWRLPEGRTERVLRGHEGWVRMVAFVPATGGLASVGDDGALVRWASDADAPVWVRRWPGRRLQALAVADAAALVVGTDDGWVRRCRWVDGVEDASVAVGAAVWSLAVVPDTTCVVAALDDGAVVQVDLATGKVCRYPGRHAGRARAVAVSPRGQQAVSAGEDGQLRVRRLPDGALERTLSGHRGWVWGVAFTPDGERVVSAGYDQSLRCWRLDDGAAELVLRGFVTWPWALDASPDGVTLATGDEDSRVRLWRADTGACVAELDAPGARLRSVAFSPDGRLLAAGGEDHVAWVFETATGRRVLALRDHHAMVRGVAFSRDGAHLLTASEDGALRTFAVADGRAVGPPVLHPAWVRGVAALPDGGAVTACEDGRVRLFGPDGALRATMAGHTERVRQVAASPDGLAVASVSDDGVLRGWCGRTGAARFERALGLGSLRAVCFDAAGGRLAVGAEDGSVRVFDTDGAAGPVVSGHTRRIWGVRFLGKDRLASASEDGTVRVVALDGSAAPLVLRALRPYEGLDLVGATGLTDSQRAALAALGARVAGPLGG